MTKTSEVRTYTWSSLSFPLWRAPRPSFEAFDAVDALLKERLTCEVVRRETKPGGHEARCGWLIWSFCISIDEKQRMAVQTALELHFGVQAGADFCWNGTGVVVTTHDVGAMGQHIQH